MIYLWRYDEYIGGVQYIGGISIVHPWCPVHRGFYTNQRLSSISSLTCIMKPPCCTHDIPPMNWIPPDILMISPHMNRISPTWIMISPTWIMIFLMNWTPPDVLMISLTWILISPDVLNIPDVLKISPNVLMISPDVLNTHYTGVSIFMFVCHTTMHSICDRWKKNIKKSSFTRNQLHRMKYYHLFSGPQE